MMQEKSLQMKMETTNGHLEECILSAIEQFWGFSLPKDYRNFIIETNGGVPKDSLFVFPNNDDGSCVVDFFGVIKDFNNNILLQQKLLETRVPKNMLPIAQDVYGNLILIAVKNPDRGRIFFWDHEMEANPAQGEVPDYSNLTLIANSFEEFFSGLYSPDEGK